MGDRIVKRETVMDHGAGRRDVVEEKVTRVGHGHGEEVGGAAAGAVGGAVVGSVVPGIGTAVGAVVGGAAGAIAGKADEEHKETVVEVRTPRTR
jgi:phage tail tape-measure protein